MNIKTNTFPRFAVVFLSIGLIGTPCVNAQIGEEVQRVDEFQQPIGFGFGEEQLAFDPGTRDANGNRLIVDGRIITGEDLSTFSSGTLATGGQSLSGAGFLNQSFGQSTAIGNQLNVITQGSFNTIIVDSTQTNNGNQTAIAGNDTSEIILNGELDLND